MSDESPPKSGIILYQTEDGRTRLEVRLQGETVWLSLNQLAELFQRDKSVISRHIKNLFEEAELRPEATVAKSATVQTEGGKQVTREREILTHAGSVSHAAALAMAEAEFEKFRTLEAARPSPVEQHFTEAIEQVKRLGKSKRSKMKP